MFNQFGCDISIKIEREKFNGKWKDFIKSDPDNKNIYDDFGQLRSIPASISTAGPDFQTLSKKLLFEFG